MNWMNLELEKASFRPGEEVRGTASWRFDSDPSRIEVRLFWYTEGRGDRDVGVVETVRVEPVRREGSSSFCLRLPEGPYSASGRLISIRWAVEVLAQPGDVAQRAEIVSSPTGEEIVFAPRS